MTWNRIHSVCGSMTVWVQPKVIVLTENTHLVFIYTEKLLYWSVCAGREIEKYLLNTFHQNLVIAAAVNSGWLTANRLFHFSYSLLCVFVYGCLLTIESGLWTEHLWSRQDQVFWKEPGQSWHWLQGSLHSLGTWSGELCGCQHLLRSPPWGQGLS